MKPEHRCDCCGRVLRPGTEVWLELNYHTNTYHEPGAVPEAQSQGSFTFGKACAKKALRRKLVRGVPTMKPITLRSYRLLVRKVDRMRQDLENSIWSDMERIKLHRLQQKLAEYSVLCPGEAHSNAYIDNCMQCAPQWGVMPNPKLVIR